MLAAPVMVMLMVLVRRNKVIGGSPYKAVCIRLGWTSTVAMAFCILGMAADYFSLNNPVRTGSNFVGNRSRGQTSQPNEISNMLIVTSSYAKLVVPFLRRPWA